MYAIKFLNLICQFVLARETIDHIFFNIQYWILFFQQAHS